ncbi:hypothetical protein GCM10011508_11460 [Flavobacterium lutivivi]|nr:hypothetical protein GCM10011508_11460 [Flavobacterium lutivivi]
MFSKILSDEIQQYINDNLDADVSKLALTKNPFPEIEWSEILSQIATKQKAKSKLPTWFNTEKIVYPSRISIEQTSSEKTAEHKATLVDGKSLIDLTGGFGVDDYYFSKKIETIVHCEMNEDLSKIVSHNYNQLKSKNIECYVGDSTETLKKLNKKFDWIYIDPSRRNDAKGKVFMLKDCLPNVPELLDFYFEFTENILIKTAPILDISAAILELKNISAIHVVALENEVKELLFILKKQQESKIEIITTNLLKNKKEEFNFVLKNHTQTPVFSSPKKYIFESNAAIMKSGGFDEVAIQFGIEKLHQHSHLYTSSNLIDFPGRVFEIQKSFEYNKANMKSFLENKKSNITTRNFPETVESIRKKWKIKDGGDLYTFFTTDVNNSKIVLLCTKI